MNQSNSHSEDSHTSSISDEARRCLQIVEGTGFAVNYFTDLLSVAPPEQIDKPDDYFEGDAQKTLREKIRKNAGKLVTYSEYVTTLVDRREELKVQVEDLLALPEASALERLNAITRDIQDMVQLTTDKIDPQRLKHLQYEGTVIIYGNEKRETAARRFGIALESE